MSKEKHGLVGQTIKVIMIIVFFIIGALVLSLAAYEYSKNPVPKDNWVSIVNIIFGCLLLTSPFFLNKKREGFNKVIKVLMVIIFFIIGALLLSLAAYAYSKNPVPKDNWISIVNIIFGCLLLTSPYFLKK